MEGFLDIVQTLGLCVVAGALIHVLQRLERADLAEVPRALRAFVRAQESSLLFLDAGVRAFAGLVVAARASR